MSSAIYELSQENVIVEDEEYISYGISCNGEVLVGDVSTDRNFVSELIKTFNENGITASQIKYAIEDVL